MARDVTSDNRRMERRSRKSRHPSAIASAQQSKAFFEKILSMIYSSNPSETDIGQRTEQTSDLASPNRTRPEDFVCLDRRKPMLHAGSAVPLYLFLSNNNDTSRHMTSLNTAVVSCLRKARWHSDVDEGHLEQWSSARSRQMIARKCSSGSMKDVVACI